MVWRPDRWVFATLLVLTTLPVLAGVAGTLALARTEQAFSRLMAWPGLGAALRLSLWTGIGSTLMAGLAAALIVGMLAGRREFAWMRRLLSPLLALPHAAAALGLAFLVGPSGWIARLLSPWATGWQVPPDALILNDPCGLSLMLGLAAKETPFLVLMALAAWPQTDAQRRLAVAESLGYGRLAGFVLGVLPTLTRSLRWPVHAVLAYGMTSVDMGLVLGPGLPAPLAVQVLRWSQAADLSLRPVAAAGALVLLAAVALGLGAAELMARLLSRAIAAMAFAGRRGLGLETPGLVLARVAALGVSGGILLGLAGLALWSLAGQWPFPRDLPQSYTLRTWAQTGLLGPLALRTAALAAAATGLGLVLALALLSSGTARSRGWITLAIYLPLLVPQVALVPGLATAALDAGLADRWATVLLGHLVYVLPYVLLALSGPWAALDPRLDQAAASLGASAARIFFRLRLPLLLAPILTAAALGFAVSVGQYLPTLHLSGGRLPTLTTEALALSAGGNRRLVGAEALLQAALPAAAFLLAIILPRLVYRNRRGMRAP